LQVIACPLFGEGSYSLKKVLMLSKGKIPREFQDEANVLSELGVVDADIEYLMKIKIKKEN